MPLPGKAEQLFQPIHLEDLSRIIVELLQTPGKQILSAVGNETVSLKTLLNTIRQWLGFKKAFNLHIPMSLIKLGAFLGDFMKNAPINSTGITLMQKDNIASPAEIEQLYKTISFKPRGFKTALFSTTAQVQDRWHARLYFLKPLLRYSIAFVWFWTAFVTLFVYPQSNSYSLLDSAHIPTSVQPFFLYGSCVLDFLLGYLIPCSR